MIRIEGVEGAAKLIDQCFGFEPEKAITLEGDEPELIAAGEKTRARPSRGNSGNPSMPPSRA